MKKQFLLSRRKALFDTPPVNTPQGPTGPNGGNPGAAGGDPYGFDEKEDTDDE